MIYRCKNRQVESTLTNAEAADKCAKMASDFARDLAKKFRKGWKLSAAQIAWLHILAVGGEKLEADLGEVAGVVRLFQNAKSKLKYPKLHIQTPSGQSLRLQLAGARARVPGSITVTDDVEYENAIWFGRIHTDTGKFERHGNCPQEVVDYLVEFAKQPVKMATAHGHKTGRCCFCNKRLTDERSLYAGFGETCYQNWGGFEEIGVKYPTRTEVREAQEAAIAAEQTPVIILDDYTGTMADTVKVIQQKLFA